MKYDALIVGENIRALRKKQGITLEQLSERLEKSVTHMNMIELGNRNISMKLLFQLMNVFEVDANEILEIKQNKKPKNSSIDYELTTLPNEYGEYLKNSFMEMIHSLPRFVAG